MDIKADWTKYTLRFKRPAKTSRNTLVDKESWMIRLRANGLTSYGECGIIRGLSHDDRPGLEQKIDAVCKDFQANLSNPSELADWPSLVFALESALKGLVAAEQDKIFPSAFTEGSHGIQINGLLWMGDRQFLFDQIKDKIEQGYSCVKMKVGAINFQDELDLLKYIRSQFTASEMQLRVDANGAFTEREPLEKLKQLSKFELHSIEQPIRPGYLDSMARLCAASPLPIALDEELIGVYDRAQKRALLDHVKPQFLVLKPGLHGGFLQSDEWIMLAKEEGIKYWITSALESNVGLNAIAQYTASKQLDLPQGLGTGQLYTNNIPSPLEIEGEYLYYRPASGWDYSALQYG